MDSCNCPNSIQPTLSNEENTGFTQARNGIRYSATVNNQDCKGNNSYFILYNPLHSMKDIYLASVVHTNTSTCSVLVNAYCNCNDTLPTCITRLQTISNNNTSYCDVPCTAQLYSGHNMGCINNTSLSTYAVKSNENFVNPINGGIILCPGSYYLELTKGSSDSGDGRQYSSVSWWEQPICFRCR